MTFPSPFNALTSNETSEVLRALKNPDRGWQGLVVGEATRCWFSNQFSLTWPKFDRYGVSRDVLARLAELYQCSIADLVLDLADHSNLDTARASSGNLNGLWLSRYSYFSSGRDANLQGEHTIRLRHTGSRHGTNNPADGESRLTLDLSVTGAIATGTWKERTAPTGYYRGAVYHGTIQLIVSPHARDMNGRWLGFGKNFIVNSGDWHLEWLEA